MKILRRISRGLPEQLNLTRLEEEGNKLVKKTKGHLEAEKNLRGKDGDELKMAKRELNKGENTEPEESCKRCRRSRTSKLLVVHFTVKKGEQHMTGKNGRRS